MKSLRDIIDYVWKDLILCDIISCKGCPKYNWYYIVWKDLILCDIISCEGCPKYNWCYIDSYLLSIDYLYKSQF